MIKVLKSGFYTTIQDLGRTGYQEYGVPYSGAMDQQALKLANALLGNNEDMAVLEMTMVGPRLEFQCATLICITGANMQPKINNKMVGLYKLHQVHTGDVLSFSASKSGFRSYLAVKGGIQTDQVMCSRSLYSGVTKDATVKKSEELPIEFFEGGTNNAHAALKINTDYFNSKTLVVNEGPEFQLLSKAQQIKLINFEFHVSSNNNRMAYQLEESFENALEPIITAPVLPGTVQLTPSGKLIILMRDCQTTGGYPRVLQLNSTSINFLSQKSTGQSCLFKLLNSK
ncbi:biotin-dependent carboxyltransferase family protein [Tamlana haliotis]|uniref:Biotin-dependent carboxyltransferase family protein n=1 Tax=Pseudotamlana haliotis TaxID=2614804 RepID=A0A6N6MI83_9FLAO|nr:biotin-dependent carboxyltransferase family protein [Tamlana haliotis]KAB1069188.1 biotin-dependent carboxyltransferase family protein [Tamlana haliotis]